MKNKPKEQISDKEARFDLARNKAGFIVAPILFLIVWFLPMDSLSTEAHRLFAVISLVLVLWLTEAVPLSIAALIGAVLNILLGVATAKVVFAPFAHPLIFLFIGSFIIAESIILHGLDKRFAFFILSFKTLVKSPAGILIAFGLIAATLSMWISNTAATAMMLPIALGVLRALEEGSKDSDSTMTESFTSKKFETSAMLMVAYGASVGGIATPIGTPPNIIAIGMFDKLAGIKITFFEWMSFALPITLVMLVYLFLVLGMGSFFKLDKESFNGIVKFIAGRRLSIGRLTRGEINTLIAFLTAVTLWLTPSVFALIYGKHSDIATLVSSRLNSGTVALFAACLLFILPMDKVARQKGERFTITWQRAVKIDWGTILLFGGGLSLGTLMFSTGLATVLGEKLLGLTGNFASPSILMLAVMAALFGIILSETTSNTSSANMVIPVVIAMAIELNMSPIIPALAACLGASFGFMLPVSTPPNAIVYGSGKVPILSMVKKGSLFDIGGFVIIILGLFFIMQFVTIG